MCGIIGYKGQGNAISIVINGLKTLEYRGYDSWGIGCLNNNSFSTHKKIGQIGNVLIENIPVEQANICLGHTRWATSGSVTQTNAHPHLSNNKQILVVHNGIIENFQELKEFLMQKKINFYSQTDTEIIPNLIQYYLSQNNSFKESVRKTMQRLEGSSAFVAINEKGEMAGARDGSPLVLGKNNNDFFAASDVPAFLNHTNQAIYLNDGQMFHINSKLEIFDVKTNQEIQYNIKTIDWTIEDAKKGNYKHFMLKEICEQKHTIKQSIEQDKKLIQEVTQMIKNAKGVFFVACGTSYNACLSASYLFSEICNMHINVVLASEFPHYQNFLNKDTLMIAVSQSGETADLLDAVKVAKAKGVKVISIVNVMGSTLMRISDKTIMMNAGPEICVLSTKSYTSQVAIFILLAYSVANKFQEGKSYIEEACGYVDEVIDNNIEDLKELAEKIKNQKDFFLIGRDLACPSAMEGALKIKEVSYIHAEGFAGGELKHGPIALIEQGVPVIVLHTEKTRKQILSNALEVKLRGAYIIGIDDQPNDAFDFYIYVPTAGITDPLLDIIPIQILSYYLALARNCDPDKPRNLAKSVTVR